MEWILAFPQHRVESDYRNEKSSVRRKRRMKSSLSVHKFEEVVSKTGVQSVKVSAWEAKR